MIAIVEGRNDSANAAGFYHKTSAIELKDSRLDAPMLEEAAANPDYESLSLSPCYKSGLKAEL